MIKGQKFTVPMPFVLYSGDNLLGASFTRDLERLKKGKIEGDCINTRPGMRRVMVENEWGHDAFDGFEADAEGFLIIEIQAICEIGGQYQDRIFFTRSYIYPNGQQEKQKRPLEMKTKREFKKLIEGKKYEYEMSS